MTTTEQKQAKKTKPCRCGCGRTTAEIKAYATSEGLTYSGAWKRLHPKRAREFNQRENAQPGRNAQKMAWADAHDRHPCPKCGGPMGMGSHRKWTGCQKCRLADAERKREQIIEGYRVGLTAWQIAERTGISYATVTAEAYRLRQRGFDLPSIPTGGAAHHGKAA